MVKYKFVCKNCNRKFKDNNGLSHHKCNVIPFKKQKVKCPICSNDVLKQNYHRHYRRCKSKDFLLIFGEIIHLIFKLITIFNKKMKIFSYFGDKDDQKIYLFENYSVMLSGRRVFPFSSEISVP